MRLVPLKTTLRWLPLLGILCISLVLLSGMIQAAHFHATGQVDHDCALCVAAHHVPQAAPQISLHINSRPVMGLLAPSRIHHPRRAVFFRLVSRPPPQHPILPA
jgi:hypothetical protein